MSEAGKTDAVPYPTPYDRVMVVVYDTASGDIRQTVRCALQDMERQHQVWPGCDFLEALDPAINPHDYVVDLATMTFVPRTVPSAADLGRKEQELRISARVLSFQSTAMGLSRTYQMNDDMMQDLVIAAIIGGEVRTDIGAVMHSASQAKQVLQDYSVLRDANVAKVDALLQQVSDAQDRNSLAKISFTN